jgi:hypothetical protein
MNPLSPQLSPHQPPPVRSGHSVWTYLGIILAVVLVVGGLAFVGLVALYIVALSNFGSNK